VRVAGWRLYSVNSERGYNVVTLPAGFDASSLVSDFSALGVYLIGAYVLIVAARFLFKALGLHQ